MYFRKNSFLTRIRKNSIKLCHPIYQKIRSMYAHAEVIIKFGVVFSKFFEECKNFLPYASLLKVDAPNIL